MKNATQLKRNLPNVQSRADSVVSVAKGVGSASKDVVMVAEPQGVRAEAIRALRTRIIAQHIHGGRRALAICAASPEVGCTFVAVNLAVALSQVGIKVLLIDGDLRRPSVDQFLPPSQPAEGLRQYLASADVSFSDAIESEVLPNLSVLYSGGVAQNPQELLAGERFQELMDVCLRDFDVTIVDTPPANSCADARRISNVVGYSMVVARRDKSLVDDVKVLVEELRGDHARVVGAVLNEA